MSEKPVRVIGGRMPSFPQTEENVQKFTEMWQDTDVPIEEVARAFGISENSHCANAYYYAKKFGLAARHRPKPDRPPADLPPPEDGFWIWKGGTGVSYWPPIPGLEPDARALAVFADPEFVRLGAVYIDACRKANALDVYQTSQEGENDGVQDN